MMEIEKESLTGFVFDYLQEHNFVSKTIVSGIYIDKNDIKNDIIDGNAFSDRRRLLKTVKYKLGSIFIILKNLGIIEVYNKNTIQVVNRDLMNEIGLEKLLEYNVKDFQNYGKGKRGENRWYKILEDELLKIAKKLGKKKAKSKFNKTS